MGLKTCGITTLEPFISAIDKIDIGHLCHDVGHNSAVADTVINGQGVVSALTEATDIKQHHPSVGRQHSTIDCDGRREAVTAGILCRRCFHRLAEHHLDSVSPKGQYRNHCRGINVLNNRKLGGSADQAAAIIGDFDIKLRIIVSHIGGRECVTCLCGAVNDSSVFAPLIAKLTITNCKHTECCGLPLIHGNINRVQNHLQGSRVCQLVDQYILCRIIDQHIGVFPPAITKATVSARKMAHLGCHRKIIPAAGIHIERTHGPPIPHYDAVRHRIVIHTRAEIIIKVIVLITHGIPELGGIILIGQIVDHHLTTPHHDQQLTLLVHRYTAVSPQPGGIQFIPTIGDHIVGKQPLGANRVHLVVQWIVSRCRRRPTRGLYCLAITVKFGGRGKIEPVFTIEIKAPGVEIQSGSLTGCGPCRRGKKFVCGGDIGQIVISVAAIGVAIRQNSNTNIIISGRRGVGNPFPV